LEAGKIFYPKDKVQLITYLENLYSNFVNENAHSLSEQAILNRKAMSWEARAKELLDVE